MKTKLPRTSSDAPAMNYEGLVTAIADVHMRTQAEAVIAVNRYLVLRNWLIGAYILEFEQHGKDRAEYGRSLLKRLSHDLGQRDVNGCSPDMLERMRILYKVYPQLGTEISASVMRKSPVAVAQINLPKISASPMRKSGLRLPTPLSGKTLLRYSWTKLIEFIGISDPWKRAFYENQCLMGNWSVRQLQRQIGSLLYERTGLSTDKELAIERARQQAAEEPKDIVDLIRDPYVLEFTKISDQRYHSENNLEAALLNHLQDFLLELGTGFSFESRQRRITVGNQRDYIDLVFYNRSLRCHLLIDLKIRPFQRADVGQMNFYLNYWKANVMMPDDNPPVGLILCSEKSQTQVEYATDGLEQQLFVSRYLSVLPKPEQLQELIDRDCAVWEQQHESKVRESAARYASPSSC